MRSDISSLSRDDIEFDFSDKSSRRISANIMGFRPDELDLSSISSSAIADIREKQSAPVTLRRTTQSIEGERFGEGIFAPKEDPGEVQRFIESQIDPTGGKTLFTPEGAAVAGTSAIFTLGSAIIGAPAFVEKLATSPRQTLIETGEQIMTIPTRFASGVPTKIGSSVAEAFLLFEGARGIGKGVSGVFRTRASQPSLFPESSDFRRLTLEDRPDLTIGRSAETAIRVGKDVSEREIMAVIGKGFGSEGEIFLSDDIGIVAVRGKQAPVKRPSVFREFLEKSLPESLIKKSPRPDDILETSRIIVGTDLRGRSLADFSADVSRRRFFFQEIEFAEGGKAGVGKRISLIEREGFGGLLRQEIGRAHV